MIGTCLHHWEVAFFVGDPVPQRHELGQMLQVLVGPIFKTTRVCFQIRCSYSQSGTQHIRVCPSNVVLGSRKFVAQCCVTFCFATRFHGKVALHHQLGLCSKLYRRWRWVSSGKMSHKYIGTCTICIFTEFEPSRSLWGQLHFLPPILNIRKPSVAAAVMPAVFHVCIAPSPIDAISCRCTSPKAVYKHSQQSLKNGNTKMLSALNAAVTSQWRDLKPS